MNWNDIKWTTIWWIISTQYQETSSYESEHELRQDLLERFKDGIEIRKEGSLEWSDGYNRFGTEKYWLELR